MRPLCSVVMATYQRAHLLARSLWCYSKMDFPLDRFEVVVIDDHSTDGTRDLVLDWSKKTGIRATVLTTAPKPQAWRDCGAVLNAGIRAAAGDHILLTHPEVMPGRLSVKACVEALREHEDLRPPEGGNWVDDGHIRKWIKYPLGLYVSCPIYYLSPQDQERIDSVPWRQYGAGAVRDIQGFYTDDINGHPDYRHEVTDQIGKNGFRIATWESFVFAGHSRETWKRLGGMLETSRWGSVDCAWMLRRNSLKIPTHTPVGPDAICVHQNHNGPNDTPTDRSEGGWREELAPIDWKDRAKLVYPGCDFIGWG